MNILRILSSLAIVVAGFNIIMNPVIAADFTNASVMLYRTKISQANVQMLVVVQPSSATNARSETEFSLQFASGFAVNGSASAISVSTSSLPSTYQGNALVAMPGLGSTASSVSGQTARFGISNLSSGTYYAFYITSGITTPSTSGKYVHTLSTIDGSGIIDTRKVGSNIVANDQVSVSAAIQPNSSDGSLTISGSPSTSNVLERGDEATITLTYEHSLSSSQQMEVIASWDNGYVSGSPSSEVTAITYKVGSATNTDTGVAPVINLTNRTITWTIPTVTPNVVHQVSFVVKVSSSLSSITPEVVQNLSVDGTLLTTSLATETLTYNINFLIEEAAASATSTPAPGTIPTATPAPVVVSKPTQFTIESVAMRTVTKDYARFILTTSIPSTYTVFYGLSQKSLTNTLTGLSTNTQHAIELNNLQASTPYFFRIVAKDEDGKYVNSDIFTFTTAESDQLVEILYGTALWENLPLAHIVDQAIGGTSSSLVATQHIFAPSGTPLTFTFRFDRPERISSLILRMQNSNVLGIDTFVPAVHLSETQLLESIPGYFTGVLTLPSAKGDYNVMLEVTDIAKGVRTEKLPYVVRITQPLRVLDEAKRTPIENARITIYTYEEYKKAFSLLGKIISYNPNTNERGEMNIALPAGRYIFDIEAPGYEKIRKEVVIDLSHPDYPEFTMRASSTFKAVVDKQLSSIGNVLEFVRMNLGNLASSRQTHRTLRDIGIFLGFVLFILIEYYRVYKKSIVRYSQNSFVAWFGLQVITISSVAIVFTYSSFVVVAAFNVGASSYYVHFLIIGILLTLTYVYLHYVWQVIEKKHD